MIHFLERDCRKDEPNFEETCGSFSVIQNTLRKELRKMGKYSENPDDADFVGIADSLSLNFKYKNKPSFVITFIDNINTISHLQKHLYNNNKGVKLFSINQHTADTYSKYNIPCKVIGPGIDTEYWTQTRPKNDTFTFLSNGFSNHRSGIDQLLQAYSLAFDNSQTVQLIIKDTSNSEKFKETIKYYTQKGCNIKYISERWTFSEIRNLYSKSHVFCSIFRHSGHGLGLGESSLCGCFVLAGDFDPSNKLVYENGKLLKPTKEIEIYKNIQKLKTIGLTDTFGQLFYFEEPKFYEYDIDEYANLLLDVYQNWDKKYSKINTKLPVIKNWDNKKSAENLIGGLLEV